MIGHETECQEAAKRLQAETDVIEKHKQQLAAQGHSPAEIKNLLDPMLSFHLQLKEEVESFERLRQGHVDELRNLRGLGRLLVSLRIAKGLTQDELATRLQCSPSQVCRDERNEYHGVTVDRAAKVLEALEVNIRIACEINEDHASAA